MVKDLKDLPDLNQPVLPDHKDQTVPEDQEVHKEAAVLPVLKVAAVLKVLKDLADFPDLPEVLDLPDFKVLKVLELLLQVEVLPAFPVPSDLPVTKDL